MNPFLHNTASSTLTVLISYRIVSAINLHVSMHLYKLDSCTTEAEAHQ